MGIRKLAGKRWSMVMRILAGTLGAYGLASLFTVVLSLLLAMLGTALAEAVIAATLVSFAVFAVIAMAVFLARSAARAWVWLAGGGVVLALGWLLLSANGP